MDRLVRLTPLVVAAGTACVVACSASSPSGSRPAARPLPEFGPAERQATPPPPIAGGTLWRDRDGATAVAADPDGDVIYVVDLRAREVRARVALEPGDEPGRAAQDAAGRVHVVLRRGGAVVTVDPATGAQLARRAVCGAPRGIAYDPRADVLRVACADGQLVALRPTGDEPPTRQFVRPDLRDVIVDGDQLAVTTFRDAELIQLTPDGREASVQRPPRFVAHRTFSIRNPVDPTHPTTTSLDVPFEPDVAWRAIARPAGGVAMVHQRAIASSLASVVPRAASFGYYTPPPALVSGACNTAAVHTTVSFFGHGTPGTATLGSPISDATLPVDLAVSNEGGSFAIVAAANAVVPELPQVFVLRAFDLQDRSACAPVTRSLRPARGQAVAAVFDADAQVVVQTRAPATLWFEAGDQTVVLDETPRRDSGHEVFHANSGGSIACASCHPEGGDDGRVWFFADDAATRTMDLRGGLLATAPFHWRGELQDLPTLMNAIFVGRMSGPVLSREHDEALAHWLDALPFPRASAPPDAAAVARGEALFNDPVVACASCHAGPHLTNNTTVDVGTGEALQVPSLRGLRWRTSYMHTGCARSLAARFDPVCGGARHGDTSRLSPSQLADLTAYLATL